MADPARDKDGRVIPHDDREAIPDDSFVLRSIPSNQLVPRDGMPGRYLSSGAFSPTNRQRDPYCGMSVDSGALLEQAGKQEKDSLKEGHEALVKVRAGDLRELGCDVGTDPVMEAPQNPFHCEVWNVTSTRRRKIKRRAVWVIRPQDVAESMED